MKITLILKVCTHKSQLERLMMGPVKRHLNDAKNTIKSLPGTREWFCGGIRSAAVAAELLKKGKIIAVPTDTIYGLAGLSQNNESISKLYSIKNRDLSKPLAVCLGEVEDIEKWAHVDDLPNGLIENLLPGPTTVILKRKGTLNPLLNLGIPNVGIRIPQFKFIRTVVKMVNQPLALTSANISNQRSTLHPSEFTELWPHLGGIFYEKMSTTNLKRSWRSGSTIVDLTEKGKFKIVRKGIGYAKTMKTLNIYKLKRITDKNATTKMESVSDEVTKETIEHSETSEDFKNVPVEN